MHQHRQHVAAVDQAAVEQGEARQRHEQHQGGRRHDPGGIRGADRLFGGRGRFGGFLGHAQWREQRQQQEYAQRRQQLLNQLMALPNGAWRGIMAQANSNVAILYEDVTVREINKIIRTNVRVCKSVGPGFASQMGEIFTDLLNVYKACSEEISSRVQSGGVIATKTSEVRSMRGAKKESLRLIEAFVETSNDPRMVADHFIPALLEPILLDYQRTIPHAKEAEVLSLMATCISKLKDAIITHVPKILECVFHCTLEMITKNFEDFPEHRMNFFKLLQVGQGLLSLPSRILLTFTTCRW